MLAHKRAPGAAGCQWPGGAGRLAKLLSEGLSVGVRPVGGLVKRPQCEAAINSLHPMGRIAEPAETAETAAEIGYALGFGFLMPHCL